MMETVTIRDARFLLHIQKIRRALSTRSVTHGLAVIRHGDAPYLIVDYIKEKTNGNENS